VNGKGFVAQYIGGNAHSSPQALKAPGAAEAEGRF
jgi:hypothetical protein